MADIKNIAIVTGANKGIGFAVVKGLCERYGGTVYLTARDIGRGEKAVEDIKKLGYSPHFHQLDVKDQASVNKFRDYIKETHGGVDLLINNAGVAYYNQDRKEIPTQQVEDTIKTNYFGLLRVCEAFFPLLRDNARVVNVSSSAGHLARIPGSELRNKFSDPLLTVAKLNDLMNEYVKDTIENTVVEKGWSNSAYVVSKVGVSALTRIQQRDLDAQWPQRNILVNSVHPGFVITDMTNRQGILTIEEGAQSTLYASLEPHGLKGKYIWKDCSEVDWLGPTTPGRL